MIQYTVSAFFFNNFSKMLVIVFFSFNSLARVFKLFLQKTGHNEKSVMTLKK